MATLVKKAKAGVKLVKKSVAVKAVAVAAKTTEKAVREKLVNPFLNADRPISRGIFEDGGRLPLAKMKEAITAFRAGTDGPVDVLVKYNGTETVTAYSFKDEDVKLAKGDTVRVLRVLPGDVALVIPGDFGVRAKGAVILDAVEVPVDSLK